MVSQEPILVRGINNSKVYETQEVEMNFRFDGKLTKIRLYVLEKIPTNLSLPKLGEVVKKFRTKGYDLADRNLKENSKYIKDLDVMLGAGALAKLDEKIVRFGAGSIYLETNQGLVLQGDLDNMIEDLPKLKDARKQEGTQVMTCALTGALGRGSLNLPEGEIVINTVGGCSKKDEVDEAELEFEQIRVVADEEKNDEHTEIDDRMVEQDAAAIDYLIDRTIRTPSGRLEMPILYSHSVKQYLPDNYRMAQAMARSLEMKYSKDPEKMNMMNSSIKDLEEQGIIEKVHDIDALMEQDPSCSFLGHKPVFRMEKTSTKCRIVFLSNVCAKKKIS